MLQITQIEGVSVVALNRPPVNALDHDTVCEIMRVIQEIGKDEDCRGLVLTGEADRFCAGVDVKAFKSYDTDRKREMIIDITRMTSVFLSLNMPFVAGVNGFALGGGMVLALCADYRLAVHESSRSWGMPEAKAGIPFPAGPLEIIRAELPMPVMRQLTLHSRIFTPKELLDFGVIDEIGKIKKLTERAVEVCLELGGQPAFRALKDQTRGALRAAVASWVTSGEDPMLRFLK